MKNIRNIILLVGVLISVKASSATLYSITDGDWSTSGTWSTTSHSGFSCGCTPGKNDIVIIGDNHSVKFTGDIDLNGPNQPDQLTIKAGAMLTGDGSSDLTVSGSGVLSVSGILTVSNVQFENNSDVKIESGGVFNVTGNLTNNNNSTNITINGNLDVDGNFDGGNGSDISGNGDVSISGTVTTSGSAMIMDCNASCCTSDCDFQVSYFAIKSGDWDDNSASGTWSESAGGTACGCAPGIDENVTIDGFNVTVTASGTAKSVTIKSGSSLTINTGKTLSVYGDWTNSGIETLGDGETAFEADVSQEIKGVSSFGDLTINNSAGVSITSGNDSLRGILTLSAGQLSTNDSLTLVSDANGTAEVDKVIGSITGDVTVQRYVDAGKTGWRFLTAPVQSVTLEEWNDDITTSGFSGSAYPTFSFVSVYAYDEAAGTSFSDGFTAPSALTDNIAQGQGYWIYAGTGQTTTTAFTVDVKGALYTGNIDLPVSYDGASGNEEDGWCLVGNPYASTIDWDADSDWTKTNIAGPIYTWNAEEKQYSVYTPGPFPGTGVGLLGGSRYIASSQAFYVRTTGSSPELTASEDVKVAGQDAPFLKASAPTMITIKSEGGGYTDEAILRFFDQASDDYDSQWDAINVRASSSRPHLYAMSGTKELSVNSMSPLVGNMIIPLNFEASSTADYTLSFGNINQLSDASYVMLEDKELGWMIDLRETPSYTFSMSRMDAKDRFNIHIGGQTLSIENNEEQFSKIYRSGQELIIETNNYFELENVSIIDITGKEIYRSNQYQIGNRFVFTPEERIAQGVYIIHLNKGLPNYQAKKIRF